MVEAGERDGPGVAQQRPYPDSAHANVERAVSENSASIEGKAMLVPVTLIEVSMNADAAVANAHHARAGTASSCR